MSVSLSSAILRVITDELSCYEVDRDPLGEGAIAAVHARVMVEIGEHDALYSDSAAARLRAAITAVLSDSAHYPQLTLHDMQRQRLEDALKERPVKPARTRKRRTKR